MIPELNIRASAAAEAASPWSDAAAPRAPLSSAKLLAVLALAAAILIAASSGDWVARTIDRVAASWSGTTAEAGKKSARQKAIETLIAQTESDAVVPTAEGADAVARNALLPVSTLPVESARPFFVAAMPSAAPTAERCLTQAIYYEAATESDAGKRAVAQVILNRMRHPAYPNSVCGVIYQGSSRPGCQFSFACDGSMRRVPVPALWRKSAEIARAALAGHVEASVGMATHYHANYVLPRWAPKLTKIEQIGAHIFYRWPGNWGKPAAFTNGYNGAEFIPAFSQLYQGGVLASAPIDETAVIAAASVVRDPTDHRTDNDVGGRVDVTKGWTPNIPDPTQSKSRFDALTSSQGTVAAASVQNGQ